MYSKEDIIADAKKHKIELMKLRLQETDPVKRLLFDTQISIAEAVIKGAEECYI